MKVNYGKYDISGPFVYREDGGSMVFRSVNRNIWRRSLNKS